MKYLIGIIYAAVALIVTACGTFSLYDPDRGAKVAVVGEQTLYQADMEHIYNKGMTPQDSVAIRELFINQWVANQIKQQAAEQSLSEHQKNIDKMVDEYRAALITHQFEQGYVENHLDTNVTQEHITQYYEENAEQFRLPGPMVKARIARIPSGLRQSAKLEKMFRSEKEQDVEDFVNICNKNNYRMQDFTTQWTDFSEVLTNIPFSNPNFDEFLRTKNFYEVEDDQYKYMMVILRSMLTGEQSPLELQQKNIRKILLHDRRSELIKLLDDSLYRQAMRENKIQLLETEKSK